MTQQEIARMKGLSLKRWTIAWNQEPVADLASQKLDRTQRREFAAEGWIRGVGRIRKNEPTPLSRGDLG
jgi:hypothetical protein